MLPPSPQLARIRALDLVAGWDGEWVLGREWVLEREWVSAVGRGFADRS
jgi:hypothetical protein